MKQGDNALGSARRSVSALTTCTAVDIRGSGSKGQRRVIISLWCLCVLNNAAGGGGGTPYDNKVPRVCQPFFTKNARERVCFFSPKCKRKGIHFKQKCGRKSVFIHL